MKSVVVSNPEILSGTLVIDTANARQVEIYRRMAPAQRLAQAMRMNSQMRELMDSGLRVSHPQLSAVERRREIARRIRHARG